MANKVAVARRATRLGLALVVMGLFVAGLATMTIWHYLADAVKAWGPGTRFAAITRPGRAERRTIARGLMVFAEAVADEVLMVLWKPSSE